VQNQNTTTQSAEPKKLVLKKQTLRVLTQTELARVAGGAFPTCPIFSICTRSDIRV
jgi:hypothetical protein